MIGFIAENQSDSAYVYLETAYLVKFYFTVSIMPIGILFNVLSLLVFTNERFHKNTSIGVLYIMLSIFNIIALTTETIFASLDHVEFDFLTTSLFSCRFFVMWRMLVFHMPSFIQVLISLSVYLKIQFPSKKIFSKTSFVISLNLLVILFVFLMNIGYLFFYIEEKIVPLSEANETNQTTIERSCTTDRITDFAMDFVNLSMRDLFPFVLILILNILSIRLLVNSKRNSNIKNLKKEYQFGRSIIAMNMLFLIIYTPWSILFVIYHINHYKSSLNITTELAYLRIIVNIFDCVGYLNNISIFFINIIFNMVFRSICFNKLGYSVRVSTTTDRSVTKI
jgi:hypothetical protein